ncbi:MAG: polysaccharide deacetylase family protein [Theionarchaea archaeon]|nr:polysaccharide deacetylase family protein [Theionarchaea archaeon]
MYTCVTVDIERFQDGISKYGCCHNIEDIKVTRKLLDVLCDRDIPSTLFILGRYADEVPMIMDMVKENGHEIASHGYSHMDLRTIPSLLLEKEICQSRIRGAKGFRAPYYGFDRRMIPYVENHFMYDSSAVPMRTQGLINQQIHMLTESLMEIPISAVGLFPLTSMSLRLLPAALTKRLTLSILKKSGYLIINVHPWEFATIPQEVCVPFYVKGRTGQVFLKKFTAFLQFLQELDVEFVTMEHMYEYYR